MRAGRNQRHNRGLDRLGVGHLSREHDKSACTVGALGIMLDSELTTGGGMGSQKISLVPVGKRPIQ